MKRRILCIDYGLCNFHNLRILVESGHKVWVTNTSDKPHQAPIRYYESLGITLIRDKSVTERESVVRKFVEDNKIDTIINSWPHYQVPRKWIRELDYIGHTDISRDLEIQKKATRHKIEQLGVKCPKLLSDLTIPCVVKPCHVNRPNPDHSEIVLNQEHLDYARKETGDVYIEEYIPDNIETNVEFVMSEGKWSIQHWQEVIGEDEAKLAGNFIHWTKLVSFNYLTTEDKELTLKNCEKILEWASTLGGSYIGQITGVIKDGVWYFIEINVRPEQSNSLPYFITGDEWLEAMHGKPEIIGDSYPWDINKVVLQPTEPNAPYPFHLHEKHGVSIPCGLDILKDKHRVARQFRNRSDDQCMGIIVVDRDIPQEFVDDVKKDGKFIVSHCFI
jgi:hypothetical protein|tara:strand:+ start:2059 stop:3225 length:1167 start_codon:yes stop_codon:yes gene_type:complete